MEMLTSHQFRYKTHVKIADDVDAYICVMWWLYSAGFVRHVLRGQNTLSALLKYLSVSSSVLHNQENGQ